MVVKGQIRFNVRTVTKWSIFQEQIYSTIFCISIIYYSVNFQMPGYLVIDKYIPKVGIDALIITKQGRIVSCVNNVTIYVSQGRRRCQKFLPIYTLSFPSCSGVQSSHRISPCPGFFSEVRDM